MMYYVYRLICPVTLEIRYVGMTQHPKARYSNHCTIGFGNDDKLNWTFNLKKAGKKPIFDIIYTCDTEEQAILLEKTMIEYYILLGYKLFNLDSTARKMGNKPSGFQFNYKTLHKWFMRHPEQKASNYGYEKPLKIS